LAKEYKIPVDPEWDYKGFVGYDGLHKHLKKNRELYPYAQQVGACKTVFFWIIPAFVTMN
jgi:hypothetical protein